MGELRRITELKTFAKQADNEDRVAAVVELMEPYLQERPTDGYAWFLYADGLRVLGRRTESLRAFRFTLRFATSARRPWVWAHVGTLYHDMGRWRKASRCFARAFRCSEIATCGWFWVLRGGSFAQRGKFRSAEKCHRRATMIDGARDEAFLNLGYVLRAQGRYHEAEAAFRSALAITPDYPEAERALQNLAGLREAIAAADACRE